MNGTFRRLRLIERRRRTPPRRPPTLAEFELALDELAENLDGEPLDRLNRARVALANEGTPSRRTLRHIIGICDAVLRDDDAADDWR